MAIQNTSTFESARQQAIKQYNEQNQQDSNTHGTAEPDYIDVKCERVTEVKFIEDKKNKKKWGKQGK